MQNMKREMTHFKSACDIRVPRHISFVPKQLEFCVVTKRQGTTENGSESWRVRE
jgi:hypothetical protein